MFHMLPYKVDDQCANTEGPIPEHVPELCLRLRNSVLHLSRSQHLVVQRRKIFSLRFTVKIDLS